MTPIKTTMETKFNIGDVVVYDNPSNSNIKICTIMSIEVVRAAPEKPKLYGVITAQGNMACSEEYLTLASEIK